MKKYSILVASAIASLAAFTSCDDQNECGCECSVPVITKIEKLDDTTRANIIGQVEAGSYIAIQGSNLGEITSARFGDRVVAIKPAYRSANTLILQVPSVTKSCIGTLVSGNCPEGYAMNELGIVIGTPTVYMMYNEFAADGSWLKLKGSSFVGAQMEVDFQLNDGTVATVSGDAIKLVGNNGDEMHVIVPFNAKPDQYLVVRNAAEGKFSICPIKFRDYRNMLTDFDAFSTYMYSPGAIEKDADGVYSIANALADAKTAWVANVPMNYSTVPGVNNFGVLNNADNWQNISFAPGAFDDDEYPTVFGNFRGAGVAKWDGTIDQVNSGNVDSYVVKFEMFVDPAYPTNYLMYTFGFSADDDTECGDSRAFAACLQQSKITFNKDNADEGWVYQKADDFSTDGWMTVSIPLSEFKWNLQVCNYIGFAQNISEGNISTDDVLKVYADQDQRSYGAVAGANIDNEVKAYMQFGSLIMQINPYDGSNNVEKINKEAHIAFDNFRVVPNDGNGAIYPKEKYGVASQHYYDNPRIKAF